MEDELKKKEELDKKVLLFKKALQEKLDMEYNEKKAVLENEENEKNQNEAEFEEIFKTEIYNIKYYDDFFFKIKTKELLNIKDIFIVELHTGDKVTYEIYAKDIEHKIGYIEIVEENEERIEKIEYINELIDDSVSLEELEMLNKKNEINYTKEELDELEEKYPDLEETKLENEENVNNLNEKELSEDPEHSTEELEEELGLDSGDIVSCTKVILSGKDNLFKKQVKEAKDFDRIYLVYVKSSDSFRFVGKKAGEKTRFLESVEPSKETLKKSIDIDSETGDMEYRNIKGLMKIKDSKDYDFSVKIGQYGCIELESLRKDESSNKYISTKVETTSQRPLENQKAAEKMMDKRYNKYIHDDVENFEDIKENDGSSTEVNIRDVATGKEEQHVKEELDEIDEKEGKDREKTLDENVKKYYYDE